MNRAKYARKPLYTKSISKRSRGSVLVKNVGHRPFSNPTRGRNGPVIITRPAQTGPPNPIRERLVADE